MTDPTPSARLEELGFSLPPIDDEPEGPFPKTAVAGTRIFVAQMAPYVLDDGPLPRLNMDANIDTPEEFDTLDDSHPLRRAVVASRVATLRVLAHAAHAAGGLDRLGGCARAQLAVRTGPNFTRLGMVYLPVNRILSQLFGSGPAFSAIGVAALPGEAPMTLEAEFWRVDG